QEAAFLREGIKILTKIYISKDTAVSSSYQEAYNTIKNVDARYIVLFANQDTTTDFYLRSSNYSLIGPRYVWYGFYPPVPVVAQDVTKMYGPNILRNLMQGFVSGNFDSVPTNAPTVIKFNSTWNKLADNSPRFKTITGLQQEHNNNVGGYDCTKVLLYGLHKFLVNNPQFTPEMLANGSLNQYLLPSAFANTGYNGLTYSPTLLDSNGDLQIPTLYLTFDYDMMLGLKPIDKSAAFGMVDLNNTFIPLNNLPVFYGGSNIPPPDGLLDTDLSIPWLSPAVWVGVLILIVGIAVALLSGWSQSFSPHGYYQNAGHTSSLHMCLLYERNRPNTTSSYKYFSALVAYLSLLTATIVYLSFLISSIQNPFSGSAFLSSFSLLTSLAFLFNSLTICLAEPSTEMIIVRNVIIWAVNMWNKIFLIVPRWMELRTRDPPTLTRNAASNISNGSEGLHFPQVRSSQTLAVLNSPSNEAKESRVVPHQNLGNAYMTFRWQHCLLWSSWKRVNIIVFSRSDKTWIVFDYEDGAVGVRLSEGDEINISRMKADIVMENYVSRMFFGRLEFDGVYKAQSFVEAWQNFEKRPSGGSSKTL
ncbi:hypothetical protein HDU76_004110, partial [Blyttiomyces sp. JEL0837]